jgi:hypothetical protein
MGDFRPLVFNINKSYLGRQLRDWKKIIGCEDLGHFIFFTHAECA